MAKLTLLNFLKFATYLTWPLLVWLTVISFLYTPSTVEKWHFRQSHPLSQKEKVLNKKVFNYLQKGQNLPDEFSQKEKNHLKDVSFLFKLVLQIKVITLFLLLLVFLILASQKKLLLFWQAVKLSSFIFALIQLAFVLLAWLSFASFFNFFHRLFFIPDSWLFPSTSILIKLYPFDFWAQMALLCFGLTSLLLVAVSFSLLRALSSRKLKN